MVKLFFNLELNKGQGSVELDRFSHLASREEHDEVVKLLWDRGADPGAVITIESSGRAHVFIQTPLPVASVFGYESLVELLLSWKVDVEVKNENGFRALSLAALHSRGGVVRLLREKGANPKFF